MSEKYHIIPNCDQYFAIVKCTEQKLNTIFDYGIKSCLTPDNAIDVRELGAWFCIHNIKHMFAIGKIRNPILWVLVALNIKQAKRNAKDLWLDKQEVIELLDIPKEQREELMW